MYDPPMEFSGASDHEMELESERSNSSACYLPWPENGEPIRFTAITDAVRSAIKFAYKLERQNLGSDIPWQGPNIGNVEKRSCLQPIEGLSAESLAYLQEDQGRDALDEIIGNAVRIGIEQGRRMAAGQ